jgi:hypothetical protein
MCGSDGYGCMKIQIIHIHIYQGNVNMDIYIHIHFYGAFVVLGSVRKY